MSTGLVAICIPYYKKVECLIRLLNSIKGQTYTNYVVLVGDDGNDYRVKNLIDEMPENYMYYCNKERLGSTANCNSLFLLAKSFSPEYIKVMHQDDYFASESSLEKFVDAFEKNSNIFFAFSNHSVNDNMRGVYYHEVNYSIIEKLHSEPCTIFCENVIGGPSETMVKNCSIFMDEFLTFLVDIDWYYKLLREYNCNFYFIEEVLVTNGTDGNRLTDECLRNMQMVQNEYAYVYIKNDKLHKDLFVEKMVKNTLRNYDGIVKNGFYIYEEYWAIIRDLIRDGYSLRIWKEETNGDNVSNFIEKRIKDEIDRFGLKKYIDSKGNNKYFWIIVCEKAKIIRKQLNQNDEIALPFIKKYFE